MAVMRSMVLVLTGFLLFTFSLDASAQTKEELEKRRTEIQQEIASYKKRNLRFLKIEKPASLN